MFEVWKLKWRLWKIARTTAKETEKLKKRNAEAAEFQQLEWDEQTAVKDAESYFDYAEGQRLRRQAVALDVEVPPITDLTMWYDDGESGLMWFTSKGRAHVRKMVDEEKARRFEVKTLWVTKVIIPLAGLLVGIIGALTGLFAVMHRKADQPEKKPPVYQRLKVESDCTHPGAT